MPEPKIFDMNRVAQESLSVDSSGARVPPQAVDVETAVLGAMLIIDATTEYLLL